MKKEDKHVPLCDAVINNDYPLFLKELELSKNIDERDYNNVTALWYASFYGQTEMVRLLIEKGADIHVKDEFGNTPLWRAVMRYDVANDNGELIKMLIKAGSDINEKNIKGFSPLDVAETIMGFPYLHLLNKEGD